MAKAAIDVIQAANAQMKSARDIKKHLFKIYSEMERVPMYLSPMYRPYFGNVMTVKVNGIAICFKVDGSTQVIPRVFADEVTRRRMCIDNMRIKSEQMANIQGTTNALLEKSNFFNRKKGQGYTCPFISKEVYMHIAKLVSAVNAKLAGETLTYNQMQLFLNEVIDDINTTLNACYPSFDDLTDQDSYDFFPDNYIRSVVVTGAAYKFYVTDEEGIATATQYGYDYQDRLFYMLRDFSNRVPEAYRAVDQGFVTPTVPTETISDWW